MLGDDLIDSSVDIVEDIIELLYPYDLCMDWIVLKREKDGQPFANIIIDN